MKLSQTTISVFQCLVQGRDAYADSVVYALEEAGIYPSKNPDGSRTIHFNAITIPMTREAEWVGGDKWVRLAEGVLGRKAITPSGEQFPSGPTASPAQ